MSSSGSSSRCAHSLRASNATQGLQHHAVDRGRNIFYAIQKTEPAAADPPSPFKPGVARQGEDSNTSACAAVSHALTTVLSESSEYPLWTSNEMTQSSRYIRYPWDRSRVARRQIQQNWAPSTSSSGAILCTDLRMHVWQQRTRFPGWTYTLPLVVGLRRSNTLCRCATTPDKDESAGRILLLGIFAAHVEHIHAIVLPRSPRSLSDAITKGWATATRMAVILN